MDRPRDNRCRMRRVGAVFIGILGMTLAGLARVRALADGPHTLHLQATDGSWRRDVVEETVPLHVDHTPPALGVAVTPAAQGRTTAVFVATSEPASVTASIGGRELRVHPVGDLRWRGLVGFAIEQPVGTLPLVVTASDEAGNVATRTLAIDVAPTVFEVGGAIPISARTERERADTAGVERMFAERDAAFRADLPAQFWTGPMIRPVAGRETSSFGKYRSFSDGGKSHHNGIDIAAPAGTPVVAAAEGVVTFAGHQPFYGHVVIVGHGHGVATSYNHLERIEVRVGDRVAAGQRIGRVGSSGNATGPHLHWGLTVQGVHVDAGQWTRDAFTLSVHDPS